jgi:putative transcriptional regulator
MRGEKLKVSQAVFANYLKVSAKRVQAWEQGIGKPAGAALRLLRIARKNPDILVGAA